MKTTIKKHLLVCLGFTIGTFIGILIFGDTKESLRILFGWIIGYWAFYFLWCNTIKLSKNKSKQQIKIHKVGESKCFVYKEDGKWIQVRFLNSAWNNKYYVITEIVEFFYYSCSLMTKDEIIKQYGEEVKEFFE